MFLAAQLDKERERRKLPDASALATVPDWADRYARWQKYEAAARRRSSPPSRSFAAKAG